MGAFFVVEAVARSENSEEIDAYKGLAQRSPLLALAMLIFLLSLGGIPFVAGFWAKLYVFLAAIDCGCTAWCSSGPSSPSSRSITTCSSRAGLYRSARADGPHSGTRAPRSRDRHLPPRRRRHGRMARPMGRRHAARRRQRVRGTLSVSSINASLRLCDGANRATVRRCVRRCERATCTKRCSSAINVPNEPHAFTASAGRLHLGVSQRFGFRFAPRIPTGWRDFHIPYHSEVRRVRPHFVERCATGQAPGDSFHPPCRGRSIPVSKP